MTNTNIVAHTPTPWRAGDLDETDRNERMVIRAEHVDGQPYVAICPVPIVGNHEANATLIVTAVNERPALLALLQEQLVFEKYRIHTEDGPACQFCFAHWEYIEDTNDVDLHTEWHKDDCWIVRVRAALAAVEVER